MRNWNDNMNEAPRDGEIEGLHSSGEVSLMFWSDRPVCMLGQRNGGFPEGWATCGPETDYNLPLDADDLVAWRHCS